MWGQEAMFLINSRSGCLLNSLMNGRGLAKMVSLVYRVCGWVGKILIFTV